MNLKEVLENFVTDIDTFKEIGTISILPMFSTIYNNIKNKKEIEELKKIAEEYIDYIDNQYSYLKERKTIKKLQEALPKISIPEEGTIAHLITYKTKIPMEIKANGEIFIKDKFLSEIYGIPQTLSLDLLIELENELYFKIKARELQEIIIDRSEARRLDAKKVKKIPDTAKDYVAVILIPIKDKKRKKDSLYGDIVKYEKRIGIVKFDEKEMLFYIMSEGGGYYKAEEYVAEFYIPLERIVPSKTEKEETKNTSSKKRRLKP